MSWKASAFAKAVRTFADGKPLNTVDKCVLMVLGEYTNPETERAWPSVAQLARDCCLTPAGCRKALHRLVAGEIISVVPRRRPDGGADSNEYFFRTGKWADDVSPDQGTKPNLQGGGTKRSEGGGTKRGGQGVLNEGEGYIGRTDIKPTLNRQGTTPLPPSRPADTPGTPTTAAGREKPPTPPAPPPKPIPISPAREIANAAASICRAFTFTSPKIRKAIADAIALAMEHPDCDRTVAQLGETMTKRWTEYCEMAQYLRYTYSPEKFFEGGFWRPDAGWPLDLVRYRRDLEASVGNRRG